MHPREDLSTHREKARGLTMTSLFISLGSPRKIKPGCPLRAEFARSGDFRQSAAAHDLGINPHAKLDGRSFKRRDSLKKASGNAQDHCARRADECVRSNTAGNNTVSPTVR